VPIRRSGALIVAQSVEPACQLLFRVVRQRGAGTVLQVSARAVDAGSVFDVQPDHGELSTARPGEEELHVVSVAERRRDDGEEHRAREEQIELDVADAVLTGALTPDRVDGGCTLRSPGVEPGDRTGTRTQPSVVSVIMSSVVSVIMSSVVSVIMSSRVLSTPSTGLSRSSVPPSLLHAAVPSERTATADAAAIRRVMLVFRLFVMPEPLPRPSHN